uniref:Late embryogenesis abundant protein LEA-2 subgroup domain-containing protein n=1 Tax=Aegilops tauschii subsp. strangulata TaxID=200361 RepID=A0A453H972_AEGTS
MAAAERLRSVPFDVDITVPVRLQLGGVRTWAVPVTVRCAMTVDRLAASAKVVSRPCDVNVPFSFRSGGTDAADARKNGYWLIRRAVLAGSGQGFMLLP